MKFIVYFTVFVFFLSGSRSFLFSSEKEPSDSMLILQTNEDLSKPITYSGIISKVNPIIDTFNVEERMFKLASSGQVLVNEMKKSLSDVKNGDTVEVVYFFRKNGIHQAIKLTKIKSKESEPKK